MDRRIKKDVQKNLPPKTVHMVPCCTISQPEPTSFEEIENTIEKYYNKNFLIVLNIFVKY